MQELTIQKDWGFKAKLSWNSAQPTAIGDGKKTWWHKHS